jgi:hypothetical protein
MCILVEQNGCMSKTMKMNNVLNARITTPLVLESKYCMIHLFLSFKIKQLFIINQFVTYRIVSFTNQIKILIFLNELIYFLISPL